LAVGVANLKQAFRQKARRNEFVVGFTFDPVLSKPLSLTPPDLTRKETDLRPGKEAARFWLSADPAWRSV
jgi:hypothetical protein